MFKKIAAIGVLFFIEKSGIAQCSICTKTAEQLGEGPASALNGAIVYLMFAPLLIMAFIGYRWWKKEKEYLLEESKQSKL
jgi:hypothetical protein